MHLNETFAPVPLETIYAILQATAAAAAHGVQQHRAMVAMIPEDG